jgi:hypothetical protein
MQNVASVAGRVAGPLRRGQDVGRWQVRPQFPGDELGGLLPVRVPPCRGANGPN